MPQDQTKQRNFVEEIKLRAVEQALHAFHTVPETLLYDPQGRMLIEVSLSDAEISAAALQLGRKPSAKITVSLDVFDPLCEELRDAYMNQYKHHLLQAAQLKVLHSVRGSIIPLTQEFYFHLALAARIYTKQDQVLFPEDKMAIAHQKAMLRMQILINAEFAKALKKATKENAFDAVRLIQELDKARQNIFAEAHCVLLEEIIRATGQRLSKEVVKALKHKAETTTATVNDLLHIDTSLEQMVLIAGTAVAAHDRGVHDPDNGENKLADRQILTFTNKHEHQGRVRIQIRTPSLDVKENIKQEAAIADIKNKLDSINKKYALVDNVTGNALGYKVITYNLYTALNDIFDGWKNKQAQGARYILQAMHHYNTAEQLKGEAGVFCFVQNISVNGFGDGLGYGNNELQTEATLVAEIAMLHNLATERDKDNPDVLVVLNQYNRFLLNKEEYGEFFSQSTEGKKAIDALKKIKKGWTQTRDDTLVQNATNIQEQTLEKTKVALKAMMACDLHYQHVYAKLFQALSVFTEKASLGGCKSGNERAQAINGRVAVLDSVAHNENSPIVQAITALADASVIDIIEKAKALKNLLNKKYDYHLQSAASLISAVDQGAAAKVSAKRGFTFNRNDAEDADLAHLHQSKAGKMQAHKGLTKKMSAAYEGPAPKSFFSYIRVKIEEDGIFLGLILAPFYYSRYKKDVREKFFETLNAAEREYRAPITIMKSHQDARKDVHPQSKIVLKSKTPHVLWKKSEKKQWVETKDPANDMGLTPEQVHAHIEQFTGTLADIKNNDSAKKEQTKTASIPKPTI